MSERPGLLSQAEFARHRGVSKAVVTKWKGQGLLALDSDGRVRVDDTEWNLDQRPPKHRGGTAHRPIRGADRNNSNEEPKLRPASLDGAGSDLDLESSSLTLVEAARRKENYLGLLRKQEHEQKGGALVDRAAAERRFYEEAASLRDAWLNWPARVAVIMASELKIDARVLTTVLTAHVHAHLSELGGQSLDLARH